MRGREVHTKALCSDAVNGRSKHWPIMALYGKRETLSRRQIACTDGSCFSPRNRIQHLPDIMKYDLFLLTVLENPSDVNLHDKTLTLMAVSSDVTLSDTPSNINNASNVGGLPDDRRRGLLVVLRRRG